MKIICDREKFSSAFQSASMVAAQRSPKPILRNVKLEAGEDKVVLLATDLEAGIRVEVAGVQVEQAGNVVLPTDRFGSILRESSDSTLSLESDDRGVTVRGQHNEFKLPGEDPEEFPEVAEFNEEAYHVVPARLLREMIRRTVFAADNDSTRYALGGMLLELSDDKIIAVGTDGRRLAKMEGPASIVGGPKSGENTTIIPTKATLLIERSLSDVETEVFIAAHANHILIKAEGTTIYSRLIEGRFPSWRDVFPKRENANRTEMPIGPLYSAVRQAAIVTSDESRGVDFNFTPGQLVITSRTPERGQSHVELPVPFDGEEVSITLDPRYLNDFLKVLDLEKTFTLELKDSESAAVCTTDDGYGYVIMPLARDAAKTTSSTEPAQV